MIERGDIVWLGRREPEDDRNRWYFDALSRLLGPGERLWRQRWPDQAQRWDEWNVLALHGSFGAWSFIDFHRFEGFGTEVTPHLTLTLRWELSLDRLDPVHADPVDPPVLHRSHLLFAPPPKGPYTVNPHEKVLRAYLAYDRVGIVDHPLASRRRGWLELCEREGLTLQKGQVVQGRRPWEVRPAVVQRFGRPGPYPPGGFRRRGARLVEAPPRVVAGQGGKGGGGKAVTVDRPVSKRKGA